MSPSGAKTIFWPLESISGWMAAIPPVVDVNWTSPEPSKFTTNPSRLPSLFFPGIRSHDDENATF